MGKMPHPRSFSLSLYVDEHEHLLPICSVDKVMFGEFLGGL